MKRTKIAAANWKMNLTPAEGADLARSLCVLMPAHLSCEVILAVPFTHIDQVGQVIRDRAVAGVTLAAQNCHDEPSGAFTGEVSIPMLTAAGVTHIITGHSERRQLFGETDDIVRRKVEAILANGLTPIFCCGESLDIRQSDRHTAFVHDQLSAALFELSSEQMSRVVIAYEPIWAIGTGVTASPEQAQEMHKAIRTSLSNHFGEDIAARIRLLYGGSVKADNASTLFSQPDVDGGLVGGASLQAEGFAAIIEAANQS